MLLKETASFIVRIVRKGYVHYVQSAMFD